MGKPKNYWKDLNNVIYEIILLKEKIGKFPSITDIERANQNSLSLAIQKYHGGMKNIRIILDETLNRKDRFYWNKETIYHEIKKYVEVYGTDNLTYTGMRSRGYNDLTNAMKRCKLSLDDICNDLNFSTNFTCKGYLTLDNIIHESKLLIEKYNCFPPYEILLQEGKTSLPVMMQRHYGGLKKLYELLNIEHSNISSLEKCVKTMLDKITNNFDYIDNGRKSLLNYGLNLQNVKTKQYFELDRYYYNLKVAIEVQGKQHYTGTKLKHFADDVVKRTQKCDELKKILLNEQEIYLIEIPYTRCSDRYIREQLHLCGKFGI